MWRRKIISPFFSKTKTGRETKYNRKKTIPPAKEMMGIFFMWASGAPPGPKTLMVELRFS
jgi:hypothetical protein